MHFNKQDDIAKDSKFSLSGANLLIIVERHKWDFSNLGYSTVESSKKTYPIKNSK
jgi:hypothetical protein